MLEVDGWVLSSTPVDVREEGEAVAIDRHRQAVSPAGELTEEVVTLWLDSVRPRSREGADAGFTVLPREAPPTRDYVGSTIVLLEGRDDPARVRAVSGADEHLRGPRQHRGAARTLRVARAGLRAGRSSVAEPLDPAVHDLVYIGGGQDHTGRRGRGHAATKRDAMHPAADRGAAVLAVCGGYQLLGHSYVLGEGELPGIGLVDLRTVRGEGPRLIGNCAIEADLGTGPRVIAGFENHGGRTYLGPASEPLGPGAGGHGNNGRDGSRACAGAT